MAAGGDLRIIGGCSCYGIDNLDGKACVVPQFSYFGPYMLPALRLETRPLNMRGGRPALNLKPRTLFRSTTYHTWARTSEPL